MANASNTAKQQVALLAIQEHPQKPGESKRQWLLRVMPFAQCTLSYLYHVVDWQECARIGREARAKHEEEKRLRCEIMPFDADTLAPFRNFRSWHAQFGKIKLLVEMHIGFAVERGDTYAKSFLLDIKDVCDRAQRRAECEVRRETVTPPLKQLPA